MSHDRNLLHLNSTALTNTTFNTYISRNNTPLDSPQSIPNMINLSAVSQEQIVQNINIQNNNPIIPVNENSNIETSPKDNDTPFISNLIEGMKNNNELSARENKIFDNNINHKNAVTIETKEYPIKIKKFEAILTSRKNQNFKSINRFSVFIKNIPQKNYSSLKMNSLRVSNSLEAHKRKNKTHLLLPLREVNRMQKNSVRGRSHLAIKPNNTIESSLEFKTNIETSLTNDNRHHNISLKSENLRKSSVKLDNMQKIDDLQPIIEKLQSKYNFYK